MTDQIFDIENGKVIINTNCLLIPQFKLIHDTYDGDINAFSYIHFMTDLSSPYYNDDKALQSDIVYKEFPGNYKPTDKIICDAYNLLYNYRVKENVIIRHWEAGRAMVNKLSDYMYTTRLDDSKDTGNITNILRMIDKISNTIKNFRALEKAKNEEQAKLRGDEEIAYDL